MNEMMSGARLDGMQVGNKRTEIRQAHLVRKMALDTGAAVNTFPLNIGFGGAGDG